MTIYPVLKTPAGFPRWATDAGTTLEPSEAKKDEGNVQGQKPPARWHNWLQKMNYEWIQYALRTQISNWRFLNYTTPPAGGNSIIYHPDFGKWFIFATNGANGESWECFDGNNYHLDSTLVAHLPFDQSAAVDSTYVILGSDDGLEYRNIAGAWASITNVTIGSAGGIAAVTTKYDTSDFIIVLDNTGTDVFIESTGITGGSWAAASTQPPSPLAATDIKRMIWCGGNTFFILTCITATPANKCFVSTDNGDNWAATTTQPFGGTEEAYCVGYNPDTGRIIVGGGVGGGASDIGSIEYTDDNGTTWTSATIDFNNLPASEQTKSVVHTVYYCGNNVWVAGGSAPDVGAGAILNAWFLVSLDDGVTWAQGTAVEDREQIPSGSAGSVIYQIAGSPRQLSAICPDGAWISLCNGSYDI